MDAQWLSTRTRQSYRLVFKLPGLIVGIAEMWAQDLLGQRRTAKCESCREAFINAGIPKATTVLTHADGVR
jgi:hypothetical protein